MVRTPTPFAGALLIASLGLGGCGDFFKAMTHGDARKADTLVVATPTPSTSPSATQSPTSRGSGDLLDDAIRSQSRITLKTSRSVPQCGTREVVVELPSVVRIPPPCMFQTRPSESPPSTQETVTTLDAEDTKALAAALRGIRRNTPSETTDTSGCTGGLQATVIAKHPGQLSLRSMDTSDLEWQGYSCGDSSGEGLDVGSVVSAIDAVQRLALRAQAKKTYGAGGLEAARKALAEATAEITSLADTLACDSADQCRVDFWGVCGQTQALSSTKTMPAADIDARFARVSRVQSDVDALENVGPRACPAIAISRPTLTCASGTCVAQTPQGP